LAIAKEEEKEGFWFAILILVTWGAVLIALSGKEPKVPKKLKRTVPYGKKPKLP